MSTAAIVAYGVAMWLAGVALGCFVPFLWARATGADDDT